MFWLLNSLNTGLTKSKVTTIVRQFTLLSNIMDCDSSFGTDKLLSFVQRKDYNNTKLAITIILSRHLDAGALFSFIVYV